ncbi:hypothetical protein Lser_V15G33339 [Lactuca serriola]|uniref:Expansin-like EG45 domain-containing protein n=1 Tax=Lactuca sativa TaxID=4236 RepID=A0A9R1V054_LACSA|nr:hypothetical protein LSAT_V11C700363130 [Lactuca sativa]
MKSILFIIVLVSSLVSMARAIPGTATFYQQYTPSACYGSTPEGVMIAAASDPLWDGGAICGKIFTVKCTGATNPVPHPCYDGKTVTVKIVDHCPGCGGTLDLSKEAFESIADPVAGVIKIEYW